MTKKVITQLVIWFSVVVLIGCDNQLQGRSSADDTVTQTQSPVSTTFTPFGIVTHDTLPSITPTVIPPTSTHASPSLTAKPVWPVLPVEEVYQNLLDAIENNGDCYLPCVWGLLPGETSSEERNAFFAQYPKVSSANFRTGLDDFGDNYGRRNFFIDEQKDSDVLISVLYFYDENLGEQIQLSAAGGAYYREMLDYYLLPQILDKYGLPSSVLLGVWRYEPLPKTVYDPFSVVIVYKDSGFLIEYISPSKTLDDYVQGCMADAKFHLWTWDTQKDLSLAEIVEKTPGDEGFTSRTADHYKPLEEMTSLSLEEFYQKFTETDGTQCLEVPVELTWP